MKLTGKIVLIYMLATVLLIVWFRSHVARREQDRLKQEIREEVKTAIVVTKFHQERQGFGRDAFIQSVDNQLDELLDELDIRWIEATSNGLISAQLAEQLAAIEPGGILPVDMGDDHYIYLSVGASEQREGYLEFKHSLLEANQYSHATSNRASVVILGVILCGCLFSLMGMWTVGHRVQQLIKHTQRIGRGDFSKRLQMRGNDELNQLAMALNVMSRELAEQQEKIQVESTARLAAVEQLRHVDRLNTVGRLASGVAHELGTPLNVVSGRADLIASGRLDTEQTRESALAIKSEADRMTNIIRQLLDFARRGTSQRSSVDLRHVADQCVDLLRALAAKRNVELVVKGEDSLTANADPSQFQQVMTNLVVNSIQAMPHGGTVSIELERRPAQPPGDPHASTEPYCCLSVSDEGIGISAEDRQHLFEPFFTTKDVGEGTGLGLSVSYGIVQDHDGWIDVQSLPGRGSRFTVFLPSNESSVNDATTSLDRG